MGLSLTSRRLSQVSMNITKTRETGLLSVFDYVARRAQELGTAAVESEVVGALPGHTAFGVIGSSLKAVGMKPGQVLLENWPGGE